MFYCSNLVFQSGLKVHVGPQINKNYISSFSLFSSFKYLIGGLDDVSNKVYEDAEAKAKYVPQTVTGCQDYLKVFTLTSNALR